MHTSTYSISARCPYSCIIPISEISEGAIEGSPHNLYSSRMMVNSLFLRFLARRWCRMMISSAQFLSYDEGPIASSVLQVLRSFDMGPAVCNYRRQKTKIVKTRPPFLHMVLDPLLLF